MDETPQALRDRLALLRRVAGGVTDQRVKDAIEKMIEEVEQRLRELDGKAD